MKKISFYILMLVALMLPIVTFAAAKPDKEYTGGEKEVKVYFFRGEGCSHCAEAEAWFQSIEKEYGSKFEVIGYETWNNEDNAALMEEVANYKEQEAEGVPYILVGKSAWNGFDQSYADEILSEIDTLYKQDPQDDQRALGRSEVHRDHYAERFQGFHDLCICATRSDSFET